MLIVQLIYNLAVLATVSVLSGFIDARWSRKSKAGKILQGITFGSIAILAMLNPFILSQGIIFDGRSIVLSLCALFFGPLAGIIAGFMAMITRLLIGGGGTIMGISVITSSVVIGILANSARQKRNTPASTINLYLFGIAVHVVMLILMFFLPVNFVWFTFRTVAISVILFYPLVTIIIGKILIDQENNINLLNELRESEEKFRSYIENAPEGIFITNPEGLYMDINAAACNLLGYTKEELLGMHVSQILSTKDLARGIESLNLIRKNSNYSDEFTFIRKDGTTFYGLLDAVKLSETKFLGFVKDITERKHAEEELLKLSHAVKQSTIATILINFRGETEYANPKTLEISGYSLEEVIGKNVQVFSFAKMEKDVYKELWETITSGKEWQGELLNMKKDGSAYWVSASIAPIYNDKKEIINYLAMAEEITEKKKMINELITAKEKAEGMNRLKSNFLANMSHELRTPLTGILGYAEILSSSLNDQEYREMSRSIHSCGKRLSETLNLILDLSKSETDKSEIPIKDINLEIVTKGIANLFTETARSKGIQLETIVREKNVIAKLNETLFSRVISILLDNAVKFTKSGAITIEVGREKNSEKEWSYVKIKDTGVGIPKDKMGIIWEEFRQVSEGLNRSFEGTGLGLTMAKRITELMDGVISVESEAGEGSIFTTKFPASTSTMEIKEIAKENDIAESIQSKKQKEERSQPLVLYVEDDSINRHVVSLYLKNICKVDTVQDGKAALEFVEKKHYDIILMDINLGIGMDGMAVTHEIRKMPEYANTPIVAVTAYAMEKEKEEFLAGGCTHFLAKPFSKGDIIQLVSGVVNN